MPHEARWNGPGFMVVATRRRNWPDFFARAGKISPGWMAARRRDRFAHRWHGRCSACGMTTGARGACPGAAVEVQVSGRALLDTAQLNKGSAFTEEERRIFGLLGVLPPHVSTLEEQMARAYENYQRAGSLLERYIYLAALQDRNETLFYGLLQRHIVEMLPVIYTPGVGAGCQQYSHIYRRPRGLYIALPQLDDIDEILSHAATADPRIIVVTDGERILGLGDLGVGGMGIPVGKLALYTACAGIEPAATLPIMLDVGTNNQALLNDPLYLGWRHPRIGGDRYDAFIETFVTAVVQRFPKALLHWEDFSKANAACLLERYRTRVRSFNDDIQGTGAAVLAGLLAAMSVRGERLRDQRIVMLGAGSAGTGIASQLIAAMVGDGVPLDEARSTIWLVDSQGLVHAGRVSWRRRSGLMHKRSNHCAAPTGSRRRSRAGRGGARRQAHHPHRNRRAARGVQRGGDQCHGRLEPASDRLCPVEPDIQVQAFPPISWPGPMAAA